MIVEMQETSFDFGHGAVVSMSKEEAVTLADELRGAISFLEMDGRIRRNEDGPSVRALLKGLEEALRNRRAVGA